MLSYKKEAKDYAPFRENKYGHNFPQKKTLGVLILIKKYCKHHDAKLIKN
jgi:hypothetical protein